MLLHAFVVKCMEEPVLKIICLAITAMVIAAPAFAQTSPSGQAAQPSKDAIPETIESKPVQSSPPSSSEKKPDGNETGWGGQQKTEDEQKADPKRNEMQGQLPPK